MLSEKPHTDGSNFLCTFRLKNGRILCYFGLSSIPMLEICCCLSYKDMIFILTLTFMQNIVEEIFQHKSRGENSVLVLVYDYTDAVTQCAEH